MGCACSKSLYEYSMDSSTEDLIKSYEQTQRDGIMNVEKTNIQFGSNFLAQMVFFGRVFWAICEPYSSFEPTLSMRNVKPISRAFQLKKKQSKRSRNEEVMAPSSGHTLFWAFSTLKIFSQWEKSVCPLEGAITSSFLLRLLYFFFNWKALEMGFTFLIESVGSNELQGSHMAQKTRPKNTKLGQKIMDELDL